LRRLHSIFFQSRSLFLLLGFTVGCQLTLVTLCYLSRFVPTPKSLPLTIKNIQDVSDPFGSHGETVIADRLANRIRIVCMILTMPSNHRNRSMAVKYTWARRCNSYFFVSTEDDPMLPAYSAGVNESRECLWDKVKFGVHMVVDNTPMHYDYFLKADDDTYMIMENVRMMLDGLDPEKPFITGRRFKKFVTQGYASGGGGYIISRAGLKLISEGMKTNPKCMIYEHSWVEDVFMGLCAANVGVKFLDSLDDTGRERFHPFWFSMMIDDQSLLNDPWFTKFNYHPVRGGGDCCSDYSVSFHYLKPMDMITYDYLLYHLRPYGIHHDYTDVVKLLRNHSAFL
ncbi:Glycoprotein-N-acetylgalactosamine 3-beta-galactosyltransferase, partial [Fasciolopsis buskii]